MVVEAPAMPSACPAFALSDLPQSTKSSEKVMPAMSILAGDERGRPGEHDDDGI
jgi:hypothetical protein